MLGVAQEVEEDQQPHGAPREELDTLGRFRVWGLGFGVWGLGFGVWGLGFKLRQRPRV